MLKNNILKKEISELTETLNQISNLESDVNSIISNLTNCLKSGNKILICGNGGSAAEANHLAAEFIVRLKPTKNRSAIPIVSLSQNSSILTAAGNDLGFENIFSRSLEALGKEGDILMSLSTSGKSKNILKALEESKKKKIKSISFLGNGGGEAKSLSDINLIIPSENTARIQECHLFLGHYIFSEVEKNLFH